MTNGIRLVASLDNGTRIYIVPTGFRFDCHVHVNGDTYRCSTHKHLEFCGGPERLRKQLNGRPQQPPPNKAA